MTFTAQLDYPHRWVTAHFFRRPLPGLLLDPQPALSAEDWLGLPPLSPSTLPSMNSLSVLKPGLLAPSNSVPVSLGAQLKCKMTTTGMREEAGKNPVPTQETVRRCGERTSRAKMGISNPRKKGLECYLRFLTVPYGLPSHVLLVPGPPLIAFPSSGGKFPQQWARPSPGPTCALAQCPTSSLSSTALAPLNI